MFAPYLWPGFARRSTDEDVGMILAFFVFDALRVAVVAGETATGEYLVSLFARDTNDNQGCWLRRRVAAQPRGVGRADGRRQVIGRAKNLDGALLAIIPYGDAETCLLVRRQRVADAGDGCDQLVPAEFFAQVAVAAEREVPERAAGCQRQNQ